ncbi:hypothetical protein C8R14_1131, partial [Nitrosomonas eutropha]
SHTPRDFEQVLRPYTLALSFVSKSHEKEKTFYF